MKTTVLLADDHPIVLDGLEQLFRLEPDFEIVGRCTNGRDVIEQVRRLSPDLLILDLHLPELDGLAIVKQMNAEKMSTRVILLTGHLTDHEAVTAMRLGIPGVVLKEMASRLLLAAARKVREGETWIEKESFARVMDRVLRRDQLDPLQQLTTRELEIVRMVASGMRNREISEKLGISEGTVKIHLHNIYEKLNVGGRVELTMFATDHGLV